MIKMPVKCSFCGKTVTPGTGIMYVTITGKKFIYCSSKCRKNALKLKRNPKKLKWTDKYPRKRRE